MSASEQAHLVIVGLDDDADTLDELRVTLCEVDGAEIFLHLCIAGDNDTQETRISLDDFAALVRFVEKHTGAAF